MRRLRARRAAGLRPPDDGPPPRDPDDLVLPAVETTLEALSLRTEDAAAAQLARSYARVLDTARDPAWAARWYGPELLKALDALGGTPLARARLKTSEKPPPSGSSRLDQLRQARMNRRPGAG
jgi:hypothetical protein